MLSDNYVYLVHEPEAGVTGVVDPAVAAPVLERLQRHGLDARLDPVDPPPRRPHRRQPRAQAGDRLPDRRAEEGRGAHPRDRSRAGRGRPLRARRAAAARSSRRRATPRATSATGSPRPRRCSAPTRCSRSAAAGCSRARRRRCGARSASSRALPDDALVYCAHEYTPGECALRADASTPTTRRSRSARAEVERQRAAGQPTVPTTLGAERAANPFLRPPIPRSARRLGMADASDAEVFAEIRQRKDRF